MLRSGGGVRRRGYADETQRNREEQADGTHLVTYRWIRKAANGRLPDLTQEVLEDPVDAVVERGGIRERHFGVLRRLVL